VIIDAVMLGYATDLDLLDIRLRELADVVDRFVVVEATETFTGQRKPLHLYHNRQRFAEFADRLDYVTPHHLPTGDAWAREAYQRNAILAGLKDAADDDIVLMGDCDEIPRAASIGQAIDALRHRPIVAFGQRLSFYYVNNICHSIDDWRGTLAATVKTAQTVTPQGMRDARNVVGAIRDAGWHMTNIVGKQGIAALQTKITSFSHTEVATPAILDEAHLRECVALGKDVSGRQDILFRVEANERDYPRHILDNLGAYAHLFYPGSLWQKEREAA
jgi:beta-1,4-mannosyl-glycoprotein beta-1,4-N-acetylglucosaminyltransferase